jgi:hypothetical protein
MSRVGTRLRLEQDVWVGLGGAVEDAKKMREELRKKVVEVVRGNCREFRTRWGVEEGER